MRSGTTSRTVALVVATASAAAGCGSEELFEPLLATHERLIDDEAIARLGKTDERIKQIAVVGDLDGDGVDDAILWTHYFKKTDKVISTGDGEVYILYGGDTISGRIDLARLPALTGGGAPSGLSRIGDFDGDGLADFLVGSNPDVTNSGPLLFGCSSRTPPPEPFGHTGVYLVYGSTTRFAGATPIADAGVLLQDHRQCTNTSMPVELGDLDGDGKADFAIAGIGAYEVPATELYVYYGRSQRLSGPPALATTADAVLRHPPTKSRLPTLAARVGDVDGDGYGDFLVEVPRDEKVGDYSSAARELGLVRGAASRLSGSVVLADVVSTWFVGPEPCRETSTRVGAALGDVDGDRLDDFTVTDCESSAFFPGLALTHRVFHGRATGFPPELHPEDADATLTSTGSFRVATADLDGDGDRELVLGSPYRRDGNGAVLVLQRDTARLSSGDPTVGAMAFVGTPQRAKCDVYPGVDCVRDERVGDDLQIGDLTGDGLADILVNAPTVQMAVAELGWAGSAPGHAYVLSRGP
jgi:FG-GAP repeat